MTVREVISLNRVLLGAGKFFLFIGVLVLSLEYLPWWSIPDYGKAALLIGLGLALLVLGYVMRKASAVRRELAKVLVVVLVALALSMVFMTVSVYAGEVIGMKFAEPAPQSTVTLSSFECNGTLVLNVTAVSFNIRVVRGEGNDLTVKMTAPANLIEEIEKSMNLSYEESKYLGEPSQLTLYTEYERPLILVGFPTIKPELNLEIYVPDSCKVLSAEVESTSGDIEVEIDGINAMLMTTSGDVSVRGAFAGLDVSSTSGDVNLDVVVKYSGSAQTISGDITGRIHASYGIYANMYGERGFFASTTSGDIVLELSKGDKVYLNVTADTTSGSVRFENIPVVFSEVRRNISGVTGRGAQGIVGSALLHEFVVRAYSVSGDVTLRYVGD